MTEDYREVAAREGRAVYHPGRTVDQIDAERGKTGEAGKKSHSVAVDPMDMQDQLDRLNELQGHLYAARCIFDGFTRLDLPESFVRAVSELAAIAMETAAEGDGEIAVRYATRLKSHMVERGDECRSEPTPETCWPKWATGEDVNAATCEKGAKT